jgi:hypothetical protein
MPPYGRDRQYGGRPQGGKEVRLARRRLTAGHGYRSTAGARGASAVCVARREWPLPRTAFERLCEELGPAPARGRGAGGSSGPFFPLAKAGDVDFPKRQVDNGAGG